MLDLGTLKIGITVDDKQAKQGLSNIDNQLEQTGSKTSKLGGMAKKVGKVAAAAAAATAAALLAVGKQALNAYADYEQLKGGVEKLFGDSANTIMEYANNAYKTAGISANDYMEQATSFSASLIQSLGGDTAKAAQTTDMAIKDMADNVNVFGSNMSDVQHAYQGFAKQNYSMLDNLKLGYGGTKTEMERLLKDASELSGVEYDISNLDDVYNAIHVIQEEMNITGTTAKEAAKTIEGSVNATKAAWQNLLAGLANEDADIGTLIDNFSESLINAASNIIPRISQILVNLPAAMSSIVTSLIPQLVAMIQSTLPQLVTGVVSMLTALISSITAILPTLTQSIISVLPQTVTQVINALAQLIPQIIALIPQIINQLVAALPQIVTAIVNSLPNLIVALVISIIQYAPQIAAGLIKAAVMAVGQLITAIPRMIANVASVLGANISALWDSVKNWITTGDWEFEPVKIDFETGEVSEVTETGEELANADYGDATIEFDSDTTGFETGVEQVQTETSEIDGSKSITEIEADTEAALANLEGIKKVEEEMPDTFKHSIVLSISGHKAVIKAMNNVVKGVNTLNKKAKTIKLKVTANIGRTASQIKQVSSAWAVLTKQPKSKTLTVKQSGMKSTLSTIRSISSAWQTLLNKPSSKTFTVHYKQTGKKPDGSNRIGLREVPFDGYVSELHKGEAVLTAAEVNQYNRLLNSQKANEEAMNKISEIKATSETVYNIGDVTLDVSNLKDVATLEDIVKIFRQAKAFA